MKKLFTIDDFIVAFVAALGYGYADIISQLFGLPELVGIAVSIVFGLAAESIVSKIAFSETVQKSLKNRIITYVAVLLVFIVGQYLSMRWMNLDLVDYVLEEFGWVIGLPILGFVINLIIRAIRVYMIRRQYGDGSKGFVFNLRDQDIEEVNKQNHAILGEYDATHAVKTRTGIYVGEKKGKSMYYLGIPYAKPPVGELRWKAPEPLPMSEAVFEAKHFGASAVQVGHEGSIVRHHRQSEDCLSLNVCVVTKTGKENKPVLVLFHHGDFSYGGSVDPLLYGDGFVREQQDIVFVSFNYRLSVFGFIDFSEVPGGEAYPDAINLGLLDQIAALQWIKENIAAFGGDPDRITVMGFESGATSICLLAASERAKGLFQKAFVFNGNLDTTYNTPDASRAFAKSLLEVTQTNTMAELLQLSTDTLKDAAQKLWPNHCAPTCDGVLIPADVYEAYRSRAASDVDFIVGIPRNEAQVFRSFIGEKNYQDLISTAVASLRDYVDAPLAREIQTYYEAQTSPAAQLKAKAQIVEEWNALCIFHSAVQLLEGGSDVHLLCWEEEPLLENLGSGTVDVAAIFLGNADALQMYGSVMNNDLSEILRCMLAKFVRGNALRLYRNEVHGVNAFEWRALPQALIVSDDKLREEEAENPKVLYGLLREKE